jgi:hypothetical protein
MKRALWIVGILTLMISCEGSRGPAGPQGPQGEQGEPGPGTRTVYISTTPIPTNSAYSVLIPEIQLDDMPVVSVYVTLSGYEDWLELPFYDTIGDYYGAWCSFMEGQVVFFDCLGFHYKIVIIE